jgi:hypothetical protein
MSVYMCLLLWRPCAGGDSIPCKQAPMLADLVAACGSTFATNVARINDLPVCMVRPDARPLHIHPHEKATCALCHLVYHSFVCV